MHQKSCYSHNNYTAQVEQLHKTIIIHLSRYSASKIGKPVSDTFKTALLQYDWFRKFYVDDLISTSSYASAGWAKNFCCVEKASSYSTGSSSGSPNS